MAVPIQNDLRFNFTGGGAAGPPTHRLLLQISGSRAVVSATNVTGLPFIENFTLNATYSLVEIATNKPVVQGRATTTVSYDPAGTQRYRAHHRHAGRGTPRRQGDRRQRDDAAVVVLRQRQLGLALTVVVIIRTITASARSLGVVGALVPRFGNLQ